MPFNKVVGQQPTIQFLRQLVDQSRLPHALLLLGPRGCGKLALAIATAQFLLCENRTERDACGQCRACIKSQKLVHPDLHFAFPVVGTNVISDTFLPQWRTALLQNPYIDINDWLQLIGAENKQGNISKSECHAIIKKLSLKTYESRFKVMIIWLPEYLGKEGNRLLKIIEEPPPDTHFILVAEKTDLILNTILSRCQLLKVPLLNDDEIVSGLQQAGINDAERAHAIAYLADGDFCEALKLKDQEQDDNAKLFLEWMRIAYKGNGIDMVEWTNEFAKLGRELQKIFFHYGLHFIREYLILKTGSEMRIRLQEKELETARNMQAIIGFEQLESIMQLFSDCIFHIERNANPKIAMLDASIQLNAILKKKNVITAGSR